MHTLPIFYPTPCIPFRLFYPTPRITSPLFYPTTRTPSPHSIPPSMHALSLFYPSPCMAAPILCQCSMPSPYSIPAHACPPAILCMPIHVLYQPSHASPVVLFFSSPAHACQPDSLSYVPGRHVSPLTTENAAFESAHLLTLSMSSSFT